MSRNDKIIDKLWYSRIMNGMNATPSREAYGNHEKKIVPGTAVPSLVPHVESFRALRTEMNCQIKTIVEEAFFLGEFSRETLNLLSSIGLGVAKENLSTILRQGRLVINLVGEDGVPLPLAESLEKSKAMLENIILPELSDVLGISGRIETRGSSTFLILEVL